MSANLIMDAEVVFRASIILCMALVTVSPVAGQEQVELDAAQDLGEVTDTVDLNVPSDVHVYHRVYVANTSHVSQDEITEWERIAVDATLQAPNQVWDADLGSEPVLFSDSAEVDLSGVDSGEYYLFLWGCGTQTAGTMRVPGDCSWLDPYRVNVVGGPDVLLSGHRGAGENGEGLAPENTIMAFRVANEVGVDQVEFDVHEAEDGYVVYHDGNTGRLTGTVYNTADTSVDTLTQLSPTRGYRDVGSEYSVSTEEAENARIPELGEALDYLQGTDMGARIELKGKIPADKDMAQDIYNMVEERGMVDRTIFMAPEGSCELLESDSIWGKIKETAGDIVNRDVSRSCTYPALEAIEDASGGSARTTVIWQFRSLPTRQGGATNMAKLPIENAFEEAERNNFDIIAPWVQKDYARHGIGEIGLAATDMPRDEFIEEAKRRGFDYAFLSFDGTRREQFAAEPVWVSGNRIDNLVETYERISKDLSEE